MAIKRTTIMKGRGIFGRIGVLRALSRGLALGPLALSLVAGCASSTAQWTDAEAPRPASVDVAQMAYDIVFHPAAQTLDPRDAYYLDRFFERIGLGWGDDVVLIVPPAAALDGAPADLLPGRLAAIQARLTKRQVAARVFYMPVDFADAAASADGIRLVVERHVLTPRSCPDWSKRSGDNYSNSSMSNLGCANARNIELMLANPEDLVQPVAMGPEDTDRAVQAVKIYRGLSVSRTTTGSGSSGGFGGGLGSSGQPSSGLLGGLSSR